MGRSPLPGRRQALRRALLAVTVVVIGGFALAVGWMAAAPLTSPPPPTAAPAAAPRTTLPPPPSATPTPSPKQAPTGRMWSVFVTFYGAADNDPPGSTEIAHPNGRHQEAGGSMKSHCFSGGDNEVGCRIYAPGVVVLDATSASLLAGSQCPEALGARRRIERQGGVPSLGVRAPTGTFDQHLGVGEGASPERDPSVIEP